MNMCRPNRIAHAISIALLALFASCLSGPDEIKFTRYFKPVIAGSDTNPPRANPNRAPIFLRSVTLAGHLRDQIAWNKDGIEFGAYEDLRWVESPQRLVERTLSDAVFGARGVPNARRDEAIDVEVTAFEHVLAAPSFARVELSVGIVSDSARDSRTFRCDAPCADDSPEALAHAMGAALGAAVATAADWIATGAADGP
jgi:ABC-type uncharacterized transport system auxiliary subunit